MSLQERITQQDLVLYEILKNPTLCAEFIENYDKLKYEEKFELTYHQKEMACDFNPYVDICCARAIGKTVILSFMLIWALVYNVFPNDYIVMTVPNKVHLEPVFTTLIRKFRSNSFLKQFIRTSGGINSSDFTIELLNSAKLLCRIAGQSGTGANVIGLHSPFIILDEGGYYPWGTWVELQPDQNTWTQGFRMIVSGVPTGLREKNVLYHTDMENSSYSKHRVSAYKNPRFSKADEARSIEQYGSKESDDFIHFVLGEHGKPIFSLFDRSAFEISNNPVYRLTLNGLELSNNLGEYVNKLSVFPGSPDRSSKILLGIDLGYTEPSAIVIMIVDSYGRMKFHGRIRLEKVPYPIQEHIIDYLDTKFNPILIGIDKGSAGISVVQRLQESKEFAHKSYNKKLIPIDFSSQIVLGTDTEGKEIKSKTKPFSVSVLQDYCNNHRIIFSSTDQDMITELERMTYSKTSTGDIIYKTLTVKGGKNAEDHFTSALLCSTLAYYLNNDFILNTQRKKLIGFSWLGT